MFLKLATLPYPNPLDQAITDCRLSTIPTHETHVKRLVDSVKRIIGPDEWYRLFPKSGASWNYSD